MNNNYFYKNLNAFKHLKDITEQKHYEVLPENWFAIVTDVENSTIAIENGKYKDVNMVGALTIISILNIDADIEIPFVFGGDGAFLLVPPSFVDDSKQALLAIQKIAKDAYSLHLRVGIIPVNDIYIDKKIIYITKFQVSKDYFQAIIKGGGLEYCDILLKQDDSYKIQDKIDKTFKVDIKGLECRWEPVSSPKDQVISLLIKANDEIYYKDILQKLDEILGNREERHPIVKNNIKLSYKEKNLNIEVSIFSQNFFIKKILLYKLRFINLIGDFLMKYKIQKWKEYKDRIIATSDTEKFDDMLRMVVSSNYKEVEILEQYLEKEYKNGKLFYGLHKTNSSLMTCLIFTRHGKHIHFVDTQNGGYAMAAKMLKKQLREK